jgi:deoxyadenosine/deoxycytidine kinase
MRIELVGGLGVGKTTISNFFENEGFILKSEKIEENPFLQGFYNNNANYNFPSQLWFVQTKYEELLSMEEGKDYIFDQALMNTRAYIDLLLNNKERKLHHEYINLIEEKFGYPDAYIYLNTNPEVQYERIKKRNRDMESDISMDYLIELKEMLNRYVYDYIDAGANVMIIETDDLSIDDYELTVTNILKELNGEIEEEDIQAVG